jgi:hypothetical protein
MKYYKITLLKKGQKEEIITKAENKVEAITAISNKETGIVVKAEETDIPFDEKIKELTKILKATFSKKKLNYPMFIMGRDYSLTEPQGGYNALFQPLRYK